jgi:ribosomal-protein-alanine N-acetyltransferase
MSLNYNFPSQTRIFPEIDLGNYILREKQESDVVDFFSYYSKPEVNQFILCELPQNLEQARQELLYWRGCFYRNDGIYFAIAEKQSNKMIGSIGLTGYNSYQSRIEISYDLDSTYWRRGIISKAIPAVVKYAFEELKVNRIEASTSTQNIASKNLLLKCNFTLEGILRQHRYHRAKFVDVFFFGMLKDDYYKA